MTDLQKAIKIFADGLKSMAQGIEALADRVEEIARNQTAPKSAPKTRTQPPKRPKSAGRSARPARPQRKAPVKTEREKTKAAPAGRRSVAVVDTVSSLVNQAENGISTAEIIDKSGLSQKQVANAVYKLKKQGKIVSKSKGVYVKA